VIRQTQCIVMMMCSRTFVLLGIISEVNLRTRCYHGMLYSVQGAPQIWEENLHSSGGEFNISISCVFIHPWGKRDTMHRPLIQEGQPPIPVAGLPDASPQTVN